MTVKDIIEFLKLVDPEFKVPITKRELLSLMLQRSNLLVIKKDEIQS